MQQGAIISLIIGIIAILVSCVGVYISWRTAKSKLSPFPIAQLRPILTSFTGPFRQRRQQQPSHQLPLHNVQHHDTVPQRWRRRRVGVMFVDDFEQGWQGNWFPMAADLGTRNIARVLG
jgi:hypothetical protein